MSVPPFIYFYTGFLCMFVSLYLLFYLLFFYLFISIRLSPLSLPPSLPTPYQTASVYLFLHGFTLPITSISPLIAFFVSLICLSLYFFNFTFCFSIIFFFLYVFRLYLFHCLPSPLPFYILLSPWVYFPFLYVCTSIYSFIH